MMAIIICILLNHSIIYLYIGEVKYAYENVFNWTAAHKKYPAEIYVEINTV